MLVRGNDKKKSTSTAAALTSAVDGVTEEEEGEKINLNCATIKQEESF